MHIYIKYGKLWSFNNDNVLPDSMMKEWEGKLGSVKYLNLIKFHKISYSYLNHDSLMKEHYWHVLTIYKMYTCLFLT